MGRAAVSCDDQRHLFRRTWQFFFEHFGGSILPRYSSSSGVLEATRFAFWAPSEKKSPPSQLPAKWVLKKKKKEKKKNALQNVGNTYPQLQVAGNIFFFDFPSPPWPPNLGLGGGGLRPICIHIYIPGTQETDTREGGLAIDIKLVVRGLCSAIGLSTRVSSEVLWFRAKLLVLSTGRLNSCGKGFFHQVASAHLPPRYWW